MGRLGVQIQMAFLTMGLEILKMLFLVNYSIAFTATMEKSKMNYLDMQEKAFV